MTWFPEGWAPTASLRLLGTVDFVLRVPNNSVPSIFLLEYHFDGMTLFICKLIDFVLFFR